MTRSLWKRLFGWMEPSAVESRRFAGYQIIKVIHEGEKSLVYQARSPEDDNLYVIKLYKPLYNRTARRICKRYHLRTEGEVGLALNPPADAPADEYPIVRTLAYGWEDGDPSRCYYLVQEYVEGVNVKHLLGCDDPELRRRRLDIVLSLANALAIIHKRGFIHRDVCTDNLMLRKDGATKLLDLGFMAPHGLAFKEKSGTPSYMSPEQFRAKPLHSASDIYSFGVVLFELFTGRLPFQSVFRADKPELQMRRTSDLHEKVLHETPPRPSELAADLPEGIEPVIMKCIHRAPEGRYDNIQQVIGKLVQIREREAPPAG